MKKILSFILTTFFTVLLFAEQPFFLRDWIIPEDFVWSANQSLPYVPGKRFNQRMTDSFDYSYITFRKWNYSNLNFPPYFEDNNLISWNKTYAEIIEAFKDNKQFFTYEYVYPLVHQDRPVNGIEFLDIIRIICRQDNHFEIELYFPHRETLEERYPEKAEYCYIYYQNKGLKSYQTHIPQREVFEKEYRSMWDKNSPEEKIILLLSYYIATEYNLHPEKYDCTLMTNNSNADPAARLKSAYSINNKEELLSYIEKHREETVFMDYEKHVKALAENPDKDIIEIGVEQGYNVPQISRLFFTEEMKPYIGNKGVDVYLDLQNLFILRLGAGAGFITRKESVEYGMKIAKPILEKYSSFFDFTVSTALSESYMGVTHTAYAKWPANIMKYYNDAGKYFALEEVVFTGPQDEEPVLFDDCFYKPIGEALW